MLCTLAHIPQVRVKKRFGRLHRIIVLSGNELKGKLLKPSCEYSFQLVAEPDWIGIPVNDTPNINALLSKAKHDVCNYDKTPSVILSKDHQGV